MLRRSKKDTAAPTVAAPAPGPVRPVVPVDPWFGVPAARAVHEAAMLNRVEAIGPLVRAAGSWAELGGIIRAVTDDVATAGAMRGWTSAESASCEAHTAWGASLVAQAWKARGSGGSKSVTAEQWDQFFGLLRDADRVLQHAARLDPRSPIPWIWLLASGRGLQISNHELRLRYEQVVRRGPPTLEAASQLLQGLCAKWSGSHDEMFAFALEASGAAPLGSTLHVLPLIAQIEQGIAADRSLPDHMASVAAEVRVAAERSVEHPAFIDAGYDGALARNVAAFAMAMAGDAEGFERQHAAIGTRLLAFPWNYRGDPATVFASAIPERPRPSPAP